MHPRLDKLSDRPYAPWAPRAPGLAEINGPMLVRALLDANDRSPAKVAVDDGVRPVSYKRLALLASVLRDVVQHESHCERVGILLPASSMFPATLFGVLWAVRTAVPLNFLLAGEELARVVEDAELDLILTIRHFADLGSKLPARTLFLEDLSLKRRAILAALHGRPPAPSVEPHDTAVILYTSGTAAEPKGVELTQNNLYSNCVDAIDSLGIGCEDTILNVLPPFHVFGLTTGVLVPVVLGTTAYALPRFSPVAVCQTVARNKVSVMLAIPSMYVAVLKSKSAPADAFRSVRLAVSGGEPLPDSVRLGFEQRFGVILGQGYGLTETSPVVSACSVEMYREGTVGRPIHHVEVRIIAPDGKELPIGQEGEILVRGPGVMKGYYKRPEETRRVIDAEGWLHTGDLGRCDEDGYLSVTGRVKDMLIVGGENVYPREIEAVLEQHDAVLQAAVIGVPDELRGQVPVAFVIPRQGRAIQEATLRQHAKRSLAGFKVPRHIVIRDELPKGPTGKILKRRLNELL